MPPTMTRWSGRTGQVGVGSASLRHVCHWWVGGGVGGRSTPGFPATPTGWVGVVVPVRQGARRREDEGPVPSGVIGGGLSIPGPGPSCR